MSTFVTQARPSGLNPPPPYAPPCTGLPIDLRLDANEGSPSVSLGECVEACGPGLAERYPSAARLERAIAQRWGITTDRVMVTAGGDEAIDRACRVRLRAGDALILPSPTFEMIGRYARLAGAEVITTAWAEGPYPLERVLRLVSGRTAMIGVVSPNNPTGSVATPRDLERLAAAAPSAVLLVDCAYGEFADEDLTSTALSLPNAIVIRTFSKAFGLAGMRVGYALGSEPDIRAMRSTGSPFPVSAVSLAAAERALAGERRTLPVTVARVRRERDRLFGLLSELGARARPSQANFVLADFVDADFAWRALAALGIGVRRFAAGSGLDRSLRITCPGDERAFQRLSRGLRAALRPQALLLDMDGVIADVSGSYRRAIALAAETFGVNVTPDDISAAKAEAGANNDWVVTQRLLRRRGVDASLPEVTERFEEVYHGTGKRRGLAATERLIPERALLQRLSRRLPLAIVTGRPRRDCAEFLRRFELSSLFRAVVCMEDGPAKPDPAPVRRALELLGADEAWMVGDTPDDMAAACAAGVVPLGVVSPSDARGPMAEAIGNAGCARTLGSLQDLEAMLP